MTSLVNVKTHHDNVEDKCDLERRVGSSSAGHFSSIHKDTHRILDLLYLRIAYARRSVQVQCFLKDRSSQQLNSIDNTSSVCPLDEIGYQDVITLIVLTCFVESIALSLVVLEGGKCRELHQDITKHLWSDI